MTRGRQPRTEVYRVQIWGAYWYERVPPVASSAMRVRALVGLAVAGTLCVLGVLPAGASTGIDVSNYQHPNGAAINWAAVKASGQSFVFVKATEGVNGATPAYTNPYFAQDWAGAGASRSTPWCLSIRPPGTADQLSAAPSP